MFNKLSQVWRNLDPLSFLIFFPSGTIIAICLIYVERIVELYNFRTVMFFMFKKNNKCWCYKIRDTETQRQYYSGDSKYKRCRFLTSIKFRTCCQVGMHQIHVLTHFMLFCVCHMSLCGEIAQRQSGHFVLKRTDNK